MHDESTHFRKALQSDPEIDLTYLPTSEVQRNFPKPDEFGQYDVTLFNAVGTDSVVMYDDRFNNCPMGVDRLGALKKWTRASFNSLTHQISNFKNWTRSSKTG